MTETSKAKVEVSRRALLGTTATTATIGGLAVAGGLGTAAGTMPGRTLSSAPHSDSLPIARSLERACTI